MLDPDTALQRKTDTVVHWVASTSPHRRGYARERPREAKLPDARSRSEPGRWWSATGAPERLPPVRISYTWELYALDTMLDLGPDATRADVLKRSTPHSGKGIRWAVSTAIAFWPRMNAK